MAAALQPGRLTPQDPVSQTHNRRVGCTSFTQRVFRNSDPTSPAPPKSAPPNSRDHKRAKPHGSSVRARLAKHTIPSAALGGSGCDHNAGSHGRFRHCPDSSRRGNNCNQSSTNSCIFAPRHRYQREPATNGKRIAALSSLASHRRPMHRQLRYQQPAVLVRHSRHRDINGGKTARALPPLTDGQITRAIVSRPTSLHQA